MSVKRHLDRVANIGCILCKTILDIQDSQAEIHHVFDTADRSDWLCIPLCPAHHRGKAGFHGMGERKFNAVYSTSETKLLAETIKELNR
jgi:hypothetical protein